MRRVPSLFLILALVACSRWGEPIELDTTATDRDPTDTEDGHTDGDTDERDTAEPDSDTEAAVLEELVTNGRFDAPDLGSNGSSNPSPPLVGWAPAPGPNSPSGSATHWRAASNQFVQLTVACAGCTDTQALTGGRASLRSLALPTDGLAGRRCGIAVGVAASPPGNNDGAFEVAVRLLHGEQVVAASHDPVPASAATRLASGTLPSPLTQDVVVDIALVQTATLPAGSSAVNGAAVFIDNVSVACE